MINYMGNRKNHENSLFLLGSNLTLTRVEVNGLYRGVRNGNFTQEIDHFEASTMGAVK